LRCALRRALRARGWTTPAEPRTNGVLRQTWCRPGAPGVRLRVRRLLCRVLGGVGVRLPRGLRVLARRGRAAPPRQAEGAPLAVRLPRVPRRGPGDRPVLPGERRGPALSRAARAVLRDLGAGRRPPVRLRGPGVVVAEAGLARPTGGDVPGAWQLLA